MYDSLENPIVSVKPVPAFALPDLTKEERHQVLVGWNRTEREYPRDKCIHELVEEQAERTPEAVALVFEGQSLTYRQLNGRANQIGSHLRSLGVGPEVLVGLCVERSLEMVVAMLGILKAGGAYVPLDPYYPKERLTFMAKEATMSVLLTQRQVAPRLPENSACLVWLDEFPWQSDPGNLSIRSTPESLVYVIYTSGSTGQPKGVEISHRALANCVSHFRDSLNVRAHDIWLAITTLSFDIAGLEIWLPLAVGARCVVATRETAMDGRLLSQALLDHGATILQGTPVTWRMLILTGWQGNPNLQLLCGGEAIPQDLADQLAVLGSAAWNVYGPTEATIYSTAKKLRGGEPVDIGRPVANTQLYILDEHGQPVPVGVEGDLFIGGDGVGRGYRNQPALTAERFIPNPFHSLPDARLYKTGDRARWHANGNVDLVGRADFQVKIRGFRIELGEIEAGLRAQPLVREAVAIVREDTPGEKQLVAYLLPENGATPDASALAQNLREKLPDYMIPSLFYVIPTLPLTPNGKVDRNALKDLDGVELAVRRADVAVAPAVDASDASARLCPAKDLLELELIRIWQRIFHRQTINRQDNFFDLGGHSLLAAQIVVEIEKLLNIKLAIASLFQSPTIETLARRLTEAEWLPPWSSLVPLQTEGRKPPLFLVHGWGGDVYCFLHLAQLLGPDQPVYGIQAVGLDAKSARHRTVESMAEHYVGEIRSFQPEGPYFLGGYSSGGVIAFEVARKLHRLDDRVALAIFDTDPIGIISLTNKSYLRERCLHHLRQLWNMPNYDRFVYLIKRLPHLSIKSANPTSKALAVPPRTGSQAADESGPDYYDIIASAHRLQPYPGSAVVFSCDETKPESPAAWHHVVRGGVTHHRVPGPHTKLMEPRYVGELAVALKTVLDRGWCFACLLQ